MTVCETESVHKIYERLFELSQTFLVPSEFAAKVLKRQFPHGDFKVLRHYSPPPLPCPKKTVDSQQLDRIPRNAYVFYHIGNILDPRKNITGLIDSFLKLNLPNCYLVLKASCFEPVDWEVPNCLIIQGNRSLAELEYIHSRCHCYVSCSFSEGAGMGAIEAAIRNKPVIVQEYGAALEYIDTPFVVKMKGLRAVGTEDFLFEKDMRWGDPDMEDLERHMEHVFAKKISTWAHPKTQALMEAVPEQLSLCLI